MTNKRSGGKLVLFTLIGTTLLSLLSALTFLLISSKVFHLGFRDEILIKPLSFFISLSFLQTLATGIGYKTRRNIPMWLGIISTLISLILLVINTLGCKGILFEGILPYAVVGIASSILLLIGHFLASIPAIVAFFKDFFLSLSDRLRQDKYDKTLDSKNLHNAAEEEYNPIKRK